MRQGNGSTEPFSMRRTIGRDAANVREQASFPSLADIVAKVFFG
jgi:hypothetical protein